MADYDASIIAKFGGDTSGLQNAIGSAEGMIGKFGGVISAVGLLSFAKNIVNSASAIQDLKDRTGASTEAIQAFDYAVRLTGGSSEQATRVWDKAREALDKLAEGNETTVASFAKLHLSQKDFIGLNIDQALEKIARAYVENKNEAGTYGAVIDIVGAKSVRLMTALEELGTKGFEPLQKKSRDAWQSMDEEAIQILDDMGDAATTVGHAFLVLGSRMMEGLENFADASSGFAHIRTGAEQAKTAIDAMGDSTAKAADGAGVALDKVSDKLKGNASTVKEIAAQQDAQFKISMGYADLANDSAEKIVLLTNKQLALLHERNKYEEDSAEWKKLNNDAAAVGLEVAKEQGKEGHEFLKTLTNQERRVQNITKEGQSQVDVQKQLLSTTEGFTLEAINQLETEALITKELAEQLRLLLAASVVPPPAPPAGIKRKASSDLTTKYGSTFTNEGGVLGLHDLGSQSNEALELQLSQLRRAMREFEMNAPIGSSIGKDLSMANFTSQIGSIEEELRFRRQATSAFERGGAGGVADLFEAQGRNAQALDTVLSQLSAWGGTQTDSVKFARESKDVLERIDGKLRNVFGG